MGTVHQRTERGDTFAGYTTLEVEVCTCGVLFAAPEHLLETRRFDGKSFYCPNGHSISYEGDRQRVEDANERLKNQRARLQAENDQQQAQIRAERAAKTRIKNSRQRERQRVAAGVCPCCNRSFKNLHRHMQSQHPYHVGKADDEA